MFNKSSNLYGGEWLALVFANRNQNYGAYQLRKQSSGTLLKAFFITVPLFVGVFLLPSIVAAFKDEAIPAIDYKKDTEVEINNVVHQMKKEMPKPARAQAEAPKAIAPQVKSVAMSSNIKVIKDDLVTLSPPTRTELENAVIASTTQDGIVAKGNGIAVTGNIEGEGTGIRGNGTGGNEVYEATSVEVYPEFPGGMNAWAKYIQRNLHYPSMAQEEGVQGKVFLSFVVEKDGTITDVKVIRGIGYGCDDEAIRVIKKSPRWKAGMQNNLPVRVRYNMPISYTINN